MWCWWCVVRGAWCVLRAAWLGGGLLAGGGGCWLVVTCVAATQRATRSRHACIATRRY